MFLIWFSLLQVMKVRDLGGTMNSSVGNNSNTYNSTGGNMNVGGSAKQGGSGLLMDNVLGGGSIVGGNKDKHVLLKGKGHGKTQ